MSLSLGWSMAQSPSYSAIRSGSGVKVHLIFSCVYCAGVDLATLVKKAIVPNSEAVFSTFTSSGRSDECFLKNRWF